MSTTINTGWLKDKSGEKFAPKTLSSQIVTNDGISFESKISNDLMNFENNIISEIDSRIKGMVISVPVNGWIAQSDGTYKNTIPMVQVTSDDVFEINLYDADITEEQSRAYSELITSIETIDGGIVIIAKENINVLIRLLLRGKIDFEDNNVILVKDLVSENIAYDNVLSKLSATNVQDAIDDISGKLLKNGGKINGELEVGDKVRLYTSSEGGNIRIIPPDSATDIIKYWEIDAYNGDLRIFAERQDGQHSFPITLHSEGEVSFRNKAKTRKNLEVNNYNNNNLLINSNFANCVNQRGQSSYTNEGYHIDRWNGKWNGDGVITPENQGTPNGRLSIYRANHDGWIMQYLENPSTYKGRTFTVSACVQNNCGLSARYFDSNGASVSLGEFKNSSTSKNIISFTFTVPANADIAKFAIGLYGGKGTACYIYWVKLEEGDVVTPFVPRPYVEELALCQRYFQVLKGTIGHGNIYRNTVYAVFPISCEMRTLPTITQKAVFYAIIDGVYEHQVSYFNIASMNSGSVYTSVHLTGGFGEVHDGCSARIHKGTMHLDAEIY